MNIIIKPHYADAWAGLLDPVLNCPEISEYHKIRNTDNYKVRGWDPVKSCPAPFFLRT